MEKEYKDFLINKNLIEDKILDRLAISNSITDFIKRYDESCTFDREVLNFDILRVMEEAKIDASYELLNNTKHIDVCEEQIDMSLDSELLKKL